jgi:predicted  nucleic acid-binding Zn-ribbon protein
MAKSPTAMIHELELVVNSLREQIVNLTEEVKLLRAKLESSPTPGEVAKIEAMLSKAQDEIARLSERVTRLEERVEQLRKEVVPTSATDTQRELAVLRAEFAEFKERAKMKEAWVRGLVASALVALLTSVVAVIVALVRK